MWVPQQQCICAGFAPTTSRIQMTRQDDLMIGRNCRGGLRKLVLTKTLTSNKTPILKGNPQATTASTRKGSISDVWRTFFRLEIHANGAKKTICLVYVSKLSSGSSSGTGCDAQNITCDTCFFWLLLIIIISIWKHQNSHFTRNTIWLVWIIYICIFLLSSLFLVLIQVWKKTENNALTLERRSGLVNTALYSYAQNLPAQSHATTLQIDNFRPSTCHCRRN